MPSREASSKYTQGTEEKLPYTLTTTNWGSTPTSVCVTAFLVTNSSRVDVSASVLSGSPTVSGDIITTPCLMSLSPLNLYRVEVKFTSACKIFEPYFFVEGEY